MPVLPERSDELDDVEKQRARDELQAAKYYHAIQCSLRSFNPTLHKHRTYAERLSLCTRPLYLASWMWDESSAFFEHRLIMTCDSWNKIKSDQPCPISFMAKERSENECLHSMWMHDKETEQLVFKISVQPDGIVEHDKLEAVSHSVL